MLWSGGVMSGVVPFACGSLAYWEGCAPRAAKRESGNIDDVSTKDNGHVDLQIIRGDAICPSQ